jgi:hypothetical protein
METYESRVEKYLEVVELLKQGLTQIEATKTVGININSFKAWAWKYGNTALYDKRDCQCCGKSFAGLSHISNRKYCSRECCIKVQLHKKEIAKKRDGLV